MDIRNILGRPVTELLSDYEVEHVEKASSFGVGTLDESRDSIEVSRPLAFSGSVALVSTRTTIPNANSMPFLDQGSDNACGTTALAMIMSWALGRPVSREEIDSAIRRMDIFTTPQDIVEYARDAGLEAEMYNHGSWSEVKSMIDKGVPVQALIQADAQGMGYGIDGQHYITIVGYETDAATGEEFVLYHDPNLGGAADDPNTTAVEGAVQRMSVSEFERMWGNVGFGYDNFFIAVAPDGTELPPGRDEGVEAVNGTINGVANITNGLDRIFSPDNFGSFVHGIWQVPGGIIQTVGCGIGGLFSLGGQWLHGAVEDIPFVENIVQPFAGLIDSFGSAIGDFYNGIGEAFDSIGGAFDSLYNGDFLGFGEGLVDAVGDVAGGAIDAVGDVVSGVGDAVSDFFSGW